mgnify:CR=1 FL=1
MGRRRHRADVCVVGVTVQKKSTTSQLKVSVTISLEGVSLARKRDKQDVNDILNKASSRHLRVSNDTFAFNTIPLSHFYSSCSLSLVHSTCGLYSHNISVKCARFNNQSITSSLYHVQSHATTAVLRCCPWRLLKCVLLQEG